jgi:hypothetical protein
MNQSSLWQALERGDAVQLQGDGARYCYAIIDEFSADRMMVWVRTRDLNERKLVLYDDGVGIVPIPWASSESATSFH